MTAMSLKHKSLWLFAASRIILGRLWASALSLRASLHRLFKYYYTKRSAVHMNPYQFYQGYVPQQTDYYMNYQYNPYQPQQVQDQFDPDRQPPQFQSLERRINALERQNEQQSRELNRQNQEIRNLRRELNQTNQEVNRLNQVVERHSRRLNRLNQRLRTVENRLNIPFTAQDGF
jgi:small-conductance mechanosensitive channel